MICRREGAKTMPDEETKEPQDLDEWIYGKEMIVSER